MGPTAPLQLEKLSAEEVLQHYCERPEEIYILALWERFMDRKNRRGLYWDLRWKARASSCPRGCNPDWLFLGSQTRAFFRFKRNIGKFTGRLDTPSFAAYKKQLVLGSIIDEYRFLTGQSRKIWVQIDETFCVVDDMGNIVRTNRAEELELWEDLDRARLEDEQRIAVEEDGAEWEEIQTQPTEEPDDLSTEEIVLEQHQEVGGVEPDADGTATRKGIFRSKRKKRLWGVMAQPVPRPGAAWSAKERKLIVKLLLIDHLTSPAKADSSDVLVRRYFRDWTVAAIAILKFGHPPDVTVRNRHEKRVRDTITHDLLSMRKTLKTNFRITTLRQV